MLTQYESIEFPTLPTSERHINVCWSEENQPLPEAFHRAVHADIERQVERRYWLRGICCILTIVLTIIFIYRTRQ